MRLLHCPRYWQRIAQFLTVLTSICIVIGCSSTPVATAPAPAPAPVKEASHKSTSAVLPRAGSGHGGYYQDDGPGEKPPEGLHAIPDAEPKVEPYSKAGNRPYVVFGKTYKPMTGNNPFKQRGIGSWYGKKFHGQKTSSGELYDMYKMTAAHPTLPIPSFARVTNITNGQQVIVRVNDRGPFHSGRIIDLSYTAALKLGYLRTGRSELEVERLLPDDIARIGKERQEKQSALSRPVPAGLPVVSSSSLSASSSASPTSPDPIEALLLKDANLVPAPSALSTSALALVAAQPIEKSVAKLALAPLPSDKLAAITSSENAASGQALVPDSFYIQLGSYSLSERAESLRAQYQQQWTGSLPPIEVLQSGALYRLFCGPFSNRDEATAAAQKIQETSAAKPLIVQR